MKRTGLLAIIIACFMLVLAVPAANANRWEGIEPRGTVDVTTPRMNNNGTVQDDLNRAVDRTQYGVNRAADNVQRGLNRTADRMENGVDRMFDNDNDNNRIGTNNGRMNNGRVNTLNTTNNNRNGYRATATTATGGGFSWGWLGLLGLLGLAGMRSRDRNRA
ncbi:WGxxGxxG-CTERM domain-containing protein [Paenibacillus sp. LHD-117]|uniref:WGxxGxxG-CTERM domain-containing protein n=1 Tax=Paenibacillus sp. LHD-117 TaxID=3071412 RepID=UPI0027DF07E9|nr:WGxxGxxG-CTERM domain-containing protein [Paenibacillus sp. LHD-117]MDQ6419958.1 WGxxGxxG-CTERM domain-containing protein [Paenibacillus sp. LHD-117]